MSFYKIRPLFVLIVLVLLGIFVIDAYSAEKRVSSKQSVTDTSVEKMFFSMVSLVKGKGVVSAIRFYQFTATTENQNPYAHWFQEKDERKNINRYKIDEFNNDLVADIGVNSNDKGSYVKATSLRTGQRIKQFWYNHKTSIYNVIDNIECKDTILSYVDWLIAIHDHPSYGKAIEGISNSKKESSIVYIADDVIHNDPSFKNCFSCYSLSSLTDDHYCDPSWGFGFWYRRTNEKNDAVVYSILKEIQKRYVDLIKAEEKNESQKDG